ncbi:ATP-binding protein [Niveispirillum fermenti]|uniref:ATP-binding protein n=1 Tax=Niveispirillum fermenti TaxID=1233113 RepID=UPI003A8C5BD7
MLDSVHRRVLRNGIPLTLGDRAFDLLVALAAADGAPVAAGPLMARVWPGVTVSAGNLRVQVRTLRRILGDDAVESVPGAGYRLAMPLIAAEAAVQPVVTGRPPLVGRDAELARLLGLLEQSRLVSVVGPGGVGKTCLALVAAARCGGMRVVHVELAPVRQAGLVPVVAASALAVRLPGPDVMGAIREALGEAPALLLLDNAEHLLDEVAEFADSLLGGCPGVRLLLTSREPLGISGERLLHLCPLPVPPQTEMDAAAIRTWPAVQLVLRNHEAAGWPPLDDAQMPALARLCRHLDGLPLALTLLAARLRDCTVAAVARSLEGRLQDLPLPDDAGYRHASLSRMLDWSIDPLSAEERLLLGRLTLFAGTWPVGAAVAVCGAPPLDPAAIPGLVAGLVGRSLVVGPVQTQEQGLRLLETIRQYVVSRDPGLVDREGLRARLSTWLGDAMYQRMETLARRDAVPDGGEVEMADVRAVLDWAFGPDGDVLLGQRLVIDAYRTWNRLGLYTDSVACLTRAWERCDDTTPPEIRALLGLLLHGEGLPIRLSYQIDRPRYVREELGPAVQVFHSPDVPLRWRIEGLYLAGYLYEVVGNTAACLDLWAQTLALADDHGRVLDKISLLSHRGWLLSNHADMPGARRDLLHALDLAERHAYVASLILLRLADVEFNGGDTGRAIELTHQALASGERMSPALRQTLHANLSSYLLIDGHLPAALSNAREALRLTRQHSYAFAYPWSLERGALTALRLGRRDLALSLAVIGDGLLRSAGVTRKGPEREIRRLLVTELGDVGSSGPDLPRAEEMLAVLAAFYDGFALGDDGWPDGEGRGAVRH